MSDTSPKKEKGLLYINAFLKGVLFIVIVEDGLI